MTKGQFQEDLKNAMLSKEVTKTSVLRMLLSAIGYYEIQKGGAGYEASEDDVLSVLQKEIKQRRDSIEQFKPAGRPELVDKETAELTILESYLPSQLSEEELQKIVSETIQETGAHSPSDIGKVMSSVMPKVKGKADGTTVSTIVREQLTS